MATFFTAVQQARKDGFTHLESGNGEVAPLASVTKDMKPSSSLKKNGWAFVNYASLGQVFLYFDRPGHLAGYYKPLRKE
jgi:hypothetical protein